MRQNDMISYRLQNALNFPTIQRCDELTRIINEANQKELKDAFPIILEAVFGIPGWGLRMMDKNTNLYEVDAILRFLDPMGPLFMLAYKLGSDYFLKYELSLTALPPKLRQDMETGNNVSPLYCERLFVDPQTRRPTALLLNPYELLIFRFALHILVRLNPEIWVESVYTQLTERYLCHFLPCEAKSAPVQPPVPYLAQPHQRSNANLSPFTQHSTPVKQSQNLSLLKPSVVLSFSTNSPSSSSPSSVQQQSPMMEIWRTVVLTQVIVDVWLSVEDDNKTTSPAHLRTSLAAANSTTPCSPEHARVVRCLIKHLHYFANSSSYTNPTAMDEMKRLVLPSSKLKIYRYLKYTMNHWPLDSSFRVILEAWLSYIQPWRYTNFANYSRQENGENARPIDYHWQPFVAEHLPAYSCIFHLLLTRYRRIDLACLKNAIMLYRLAKVFHQIHLKDLVMIAEESLNSKQHYPSPGIPSSSSQGDDGMPIEFKFHRWKSSVTQAIAELEGPDTIYKPMFGAEMKTVMREFILEIHLASHKAIRLAEEQKQKQRTLGFWSSLFSTGDTGVEEYTLEDRRRVVCMLQSSVDNFVAMYQVGDIELPMYFHNNLSYVMNTTFAETSAGSSMNASGFNDSITPGTPASVQNEGDPDRMPICTYEVAWLVRMFHDISSYINREYGFELQLLYNRPDMVGRLARQVLQPRQSVYVYERSKNGYKSRVEKVLPVRLSLRRLARRQLLWYLALLCVGAWILGYHPLLGILIPIILFVFFTGINAFRE